MVEKENGCMYVWHHSTINCWLALGRPSREENDRVTEAQAKVGWWDFNICFSTAMAERVLQASALEDRTQGGVDHAQRL